MIDDYKCDDITDKKADPNQDKGLSARISNYKSELDYFLETPNEDLSFDSIENFLQDMINLNAFTRSEQFTDLNFFNKSMYFRQNFQDHSEFLHLDLSQVEFFKVETLESLFSQDYFNYLMNFMNYNPDPSAITEKDCCRYAINILDIIILKNPEFGALFVDEKFLQKLFVIYQIMSADIDATKKTKEKRNITISRNCLIEAWLHLIADITLFNPDSIKTIFSPPQLFNITMSLMSRVNQVNPSCVYVIIMAITSNDQEFLEAFSNDVSINSISFYLQVKDQKMRSSSASALRIISKTIPGLVLEPSILDLEYDNSSLTVEEGIHLSDMMSNIILTDDPRMCQIMVQSKLFESIIRLSENSVFQVRNSVGRLICICMSSSITELVDFMLKNYQDIVFSTIKMLVSSSVQFKVDAIIAAHKIFEYCNSFTVQNGKAILDAFLDPDFIDDIYEAFPEDVPEKIQMMITELENYVSSQE